MSGNGSQSAATGGRRPGLAMFFFGVEDSFYAQLEKLTTRLPANIRAIADGFRANLQAVIATATVPYKMAHAGAQNQRFQQLYTAERIRSGKSDYKEDPALIASQRFREEAERQDIINWKIERTVKHLEGMLLNEQMKNAAAELLRQATVLVWGALEVLANDLFVALMNSDPRLALDVLRDVRTKKRFQLAEPLKTLEEFEFNLSTHMGDVLLGSAKLDDVQTMRCVFDVLMPGDMAVRLAFADDDLWRLNQQRNLILHRRAIVDKEYKQKTGDVLEIGSTLAISPDDLEKYLVLCRNIGIAVFSHLAQS